MLSRDFSSPVHVGKFFSIFERTERGSFGRVLDVYRLGNGTFYGLDSDGSGYYLNYLPAINAFEVGATAVSKSELASVGVFF